MSIFDHDQAQAAKRTLQALLPAGVRVETAVLNHGRTLSVSVVGELGSTTYDFGWTGRTATHDGNPAPPWNTTAALAIAAEWASGCRVVVPGPTLAKAGTPRTPILSTTEALIEWVSAAKPGDTAVYFKGNLARFRFEAHGRIIELQAKADRHRGKVRAPASERVEVAKLQRQIELINHTTILFRNNLITFSQRREPGREEITYLATRIGKHMNTTSPVFAAANMQKLVRNAINLAWQKFTPESFKIMAIGFEGGQDINHQTTANVEIYKDNPQSPLHIRIPMIDLGDDRAKWPAILEQKGQVAVKQMRMRSRLTAGRKSLDDIPD